MFTTLGNILGTTQTPRHAEQNDTRQDIQRHDPEYERRKKKKQQSAEELFAGEEGSTVSVTALQTFLNTFLKELSEKQPKKGFNTTSQATEEIQEKQEVAAPKAPVSGHAAYASNAYQHMAESQQRTSILGEVNEGNADLISLDAAEVRTIHALLEDLKLLSNKSIEYIHIERASSFLESLKTAVDRVKQSDLFKA